MADNSTLPVAGGATEVFANDDVSSVKYPRVKATWGPDGTANDADIATGKPLPIQVRSATGLTPLGEPTDAKNTATDTTSVGMIALLKQISASVQAPPAPATSAYSASVTFTPAASSHTTPACNGAAQNFTSMGPSAGRIMITSASLLINGGTAEATAWRLYLYNVTPPSATADAGAWDLPSGDQASFLGYVDLGTAVDLGSTQWVEVNGVNKQLLLSGTGLFGYLVNLTTVTPAAVAHTVTLHAVSV